jgi:hypothetical protein
VVTGLGLEAASAATLDTLRQRGGANPDHLGFSKSHDKGEWAGLDIGVLSCNATWTISRDISLGLNFTGANTIGRDAMDAASQSRSRRSS